MKRGTLIVPFGVLAILTGCVQTSAPSHRFAPGGEAQGESELRAAKKENVELRRQLAARQAELSEMESKLGFELGLPSRRLSAWSSQFRIAGSDAPAWMTQSGRLAADNQELRAKLDLMKEEMTALHGNGLTSGPSYAPPDSSDTALSPEVIAQLTEGKPRSHGHQLDARVPTSSNSETIASQLSDAIVAWKPPRQMVEGTEMIVTAGIALTVDRAMLHSIEGVGPLRTSSRQITESVYMLLTSDESSAFRIEKADDKIPDEQFVRPGEPTYWQWRVTPLMNGRHTLRLQPYVVFIREGNREKKQRVAVSPEIVSVTISRPYEVQQLWKEQKPAILSVFIFPFLTWGTLGVFRRVRSRFGTKPAESPLIIVP